MVSAADVPNTSIACLLTASRFGPLGVENPRRLARMRVTAGYRVPTPVSTLPLYRYLALIVSFLDHMPRRMLWNMPISRLRPWKAIHGAVSCDLIIWVAALNFSAIADIGSGPVNRLLIRRRSSAIGREIPTESIFPSEAIHASFCSSSRSANDLPGNRTRGPVPIFSASAARTLC